MKLIVVFFAFAVGVASAQTTQGPYVAPAIAVEQYTGPPEGLAAWSSTYKPSWYTSTGAPAVASDLHFPENHEQDGPAPADEPTFYTGAPEHDGPVLAVEPWGPHEGHDWHDGHDGPVLAVEPWDSYTTDGPDGAAPAGPWEYYTTDGPDGAAPAGPWEYYTTDGPYGGAPAGPWEYYTTDGPNGDAPAEPAPGDYPPPTGGCGSGPAIYPAQPPPYDSAVGAPGPYDPQWQQPQYDPSYPQPCPQGPYVPGGPAGKPFFQCPQSEQMFSLVFNFLDIIINMLMMPVPVMTGDDGFGPVADPGAQDYSDAMAG